MKRKSGTEEVVGEDFEDAARGLLVDESESEGELGGKGGFMRRIKTWSATDSVGHGDRIRERGGGEAVNKVGANNERRLETVEGTGMGKSGEVDGGLVEGSQLPPLHLELRVSAEVLGPAAIAVTWQIQEGEGYNSGPLEFVLRIRDDSEIWLGGGERSTSLNQKGQKLSMRSLDWRDLSSSEGRDSWKPVPFIMSSGGYGIWVDSYVNGTFDVNSPSDPDHLVIRYTEKVFRVVYIGGPAFADILAQFTALVGRPPVPSLWAFAPWMGRDTSTTATDVLEDAKKLRKAGIAASVAVFDSLAESGCNGFVLSHNRFPDPKAFFDSLQELGFVAVLRLAPCVSGRFLHDHLWSSVAVDNLVKNASGQPQVKDNVALVDLTHEAGLEWWRRQLNRTARWGVVKGFEADDRNGGHLLKGAVVADGTLAAALENKSTRLFGATLRSFVERSHKGDGVTLAHTGFTGSVSFMWSSIKLQASLSGRGLLATIIAGQTASLSGMFLWGHKIHPLPFPLKSKEMFIRWTQFGAFSPLMYHILGRNSTTSLWSYDQQTIQIVQRFTHLHLSLAPYLLRASMKASTTGRPIMCPMVLCFQADANSAKQHGQFLLGEDLLVAPVYLPHGYVQVYLPQAYNWVNFWTGETFEGGRLVNLEVPLEQSAVFVRAGAVLEVMAEDMESLVTTGSSDQALGKGLEKAVVLQVWPGSVGTLLTGGLNATLSKAGVKAERERETAYRRGGTVGVKEGRTVQLDGNEVSEEDSRTERGGNSVEHQNGGGGGVVGNERVEQEVLSTQRKGGGERERAGRWRGVERDEGEEEETEDGMHAGSGQGSDKERSESRIQEREKSSYNRESVESSNGGEESGVESEDQSKLNRGSERESGKEEVEDTELDDLPLEEAERLTLTDDSGVGEGDGLGQNSGRRLLLLGRSRVRARSLVLLSDGVRKVDIMLMFRKVEQIQVAYEGGVHKTKSCIESNSFGRKVTLCYLEVRRGQTTLLWKWR